MKKIIILKIKGFDKEHPNNIEEFTVETTMNIADFKKEVIKCVSDDDYNKRLVNFYYNLWKDKKEQEKQIAIVRVNDFIDKNNNKGDKRQRCILYHKKFGFMCGLDTGVKALFSGIKSTETCNLVIKECIDDLNLIWDVE